MADRVMDSRDVYCELCGNDVEHGAELTVEFSTRDGSTIRCSRCERWLEGGMLRVEYVDDVPRLRVWKFEWTPGELLPSAAENRARVGL